jgi:biotin transport system substrate-specific component
MNTLTNLITAGRPYVPLRLDGRSLGAKATLVALGVALLTAASWVQVPMYPVPMTMQTFAVLMIGALCGWRLALTTVVAWLGLSAGLPLLSEFKTLGLAHTTIGYLAGFAVMALFTGWLAERGFTARLLPAFLVMLAADVLCFALGVAWLGGLIGFDKAIAFGLVPFILGDLVKVALAALTVTAARRISPRA